MLQSLSMNSPVPSYTLNLMVLCIEEILHKPTYRLPCTPEIAALGAVLSVALFRGSTIWRLQKPFANCYV